MQKDMRELIEGKSNEKLKSSWRMLAGKLKESGDFGTSLYHFQKDMKMAGFSNSKLERATRDYQKAVDDLTDVMHEAMNSLGLKS
jgi:hypothetical protein